jgi:hypothetical protein
VPRLRLLRNTNDVDLPVSPEVWQDLPDRLARANFLAGQAVREGPSWRPRAFRRFQIEMLADGREEWLEFWRENHLLAPHGELQTRPRAARTAAARGKGCLLRCPARAAQVGQTNWRAQEVTSMSLTIQRTPSS